MRLSHFETLNPICPRCKKEKGEHHPIVIRSVHRESQHTIQEGILTCSNPECLLEYPIIDGIPLIISDIRTYISQNVTHVIQRDDLSDPIDSILGDCIGPGTVYDATRRHLSTYGYDHYGDFDPDETKHLDISPGSIINLVKCAFESFQGKPNGPIIDTGCSVGRSTFELSKRFDVPVLGIDMNFSMLKAAKHIVNTGSFTYPKRKVGLVYDKKQFPVEFNHAENVDFWACDAMNLPFGDDLFSLGISFNLLDCILHPLNYIKEMERILGKGATLFMSTPFDWSENATPAEAWLGGHSQRSEIRGDSLSIFKSLFSNSDQRFDTTLTITNEKDDIPWTVRIHDRSYMTYSVYLAELTKP